MTRVVCVGEIMIDVVAVLAAPLAVGSDSPAPISIRGGGAAANVAAWLAAAGAEVSLVGRVGADDLGRRAVADLTAAGVRSLVEPDPTRDTGTCIVLVHPDGERTMVPSLGANAGLGELDPAAVFPPVTDWLYVSGYALLAESSRPFAQRAFALASQRRWAVAVDAASAAPLAAVGAETFLGWLPPNTLLFANDDEAAVLTGRRGPDAAGELARRAGQAVVKQGAAGAEWSDGHAHARADAFVTAPAVLDTTGAGDAFAAGFLATTGTIEQRLAAAAQLAAEALAVVGARPPAQSSPRARASDP